MKLYQAHVQLLSCIFICSVLLSCSDEKNGSIGRDNSSASSLQSEAPEAENSPFASSLQSKAPESEGSQLLILPSNEELQATFARISKGIHALPVLRIEPTPFVVSVLEQPNGLNNALQIEVLEAHFEEFLKIFRSETAAISAQINALESKLANRTTIYISQPDALEGVVGLQGWAEGRGGQVVVITQHELFDKRGVRRPFMSQACCFVEPVEAKTIWGRTTSVPVFIDRQPELIVAKTIQALFVSMVEQTEEEYRTVHYAKVDPWIRGYSLEMQAYLAQAGEDDYRNQIQVLFDQGDRLNIAEMMKYYETPELLEIEKTVFSKAIQQFELFNRVPMGILATDVSTFKNSLALKIGGLRKTLAEEELDRIKVAKKRNELAISMIRKLVLNEVYPDSLTGQERVPISVVGSIYTFQINFWTNRGKYAKLGPAFNEHCTLVPQGSTTYRDFYHLTFDLDWCIENL